MYVCICIELCLKDENALSISAKLYNNINLLTDPSDPSPKPLPTPPTPTHRINIASKIKNE